ncbi:radical SAM protein [Candidatus Nitronereus thalassa]|uniref:Radical SAM protein n=1 Tax=Candidatus Nitronereus thalassa TaxID=3020898 RepID=A0ABU3KC61_9BACT|nr:radical SAM protein [Candidatus Nitronereus thalassa]MDT7044044.1 radical SAM protein [Candidatus Nitronereus thalassa]
MTTDTLPVLRNLITRKPLLAIFEVCLRCNSACGYCDLPLNVGRYEMSREEIRKAFQHLYDHGLRFLFIQGGEPLVRRDLPEILEDLYAIGFHLTLITNGTKLTKPLVDRFRPLNVNISVSLDTLDQERYHHIRGRDQLPDVLRGIDLLQDYPHPKFLTCIVSEPNRHDVLDVARFARARGFIPVVGAYHWNVERYGKVDMTLQYERAMAKHVFEQLLESNVVPAGYFRRYLHDNVNWLNGTSLAPCDAGKYSIAIDASGNVAPCLALHSAGNLREQSLPEILEKMDAKAIRVCSDQSSCNMMCSRVIGSLLRHPIDAIRTPQTVAPIRNMYARQA